MSTTGEPSTAQLLVGDIAPKLASLVTNGSTEQLVSHLRLAKQNGSTAAVLRS